MINNKNISDNLFIKFLNENKLNCELTEKDIINDYNKRELYRDFIIVEKSKVNTPEMNLYFHSILNRIEEQEKADPAPVNLEKEDINKFL